MTYSKHLHIRTLISGFRLIMFLFSVYPCLVYLHLNYYYFVIQFILQLVVSTEYSTHMFSNGMLSCIVDIE